MFDKALTSFNFEKANFDLNTQGFHQLSVKIDRNSIAEIVKQVDDICNSKRDLEVNYGGSEHRLWHADKFISAALEFRNFSNSIIPKLEGNLSEAHNILVIRNKPLSSNDSELSKGRWHLDSFHKQLKIFVFMKDVGKNDGPFELIPQTQKMQVKIQHAIKAKYFRMKDFIQRTGKRGYQKIEDEFIKHVERRYPPHIFTVPAGTILVADTSAIHRAHPVNGGERYAFTSYH